MVQHAGIGQFGLDPRATKGSAPGISSTPTSVGGDVSSVIVLTPVEQLRPAARSTWAKNLKACFESCVGPTDTCCFSHPTRLAGTLQKY
jgi:hypothetical protein